MHSRDLTTSTNKQLSLNNRKTKKGLIKDINELVGKQNSIEGNNERNKDIN